MFEQAARLKLRFESPKGALTVEDLYDLPLTTTTDKASLDNVAKLISKKLKETETESFVTEGTTGDAILKLKLDLVKRVIAVRLAENAAASVKRENKEKKEQILEIISRKKNAALEGASLEELTALANTL